MRSYLTAFGLVLVMSGVASAQQEFRSFAPGLSPMMPVAGPEMSKIDSGGLKAEDTIAARIAPNAPVTVTKQPPVICDPACQNPAYTPRNFTK